MASSMSLWEVLESAIQKEIMSRFLYIGLRQSAKNQASKDAFQILADQEENHQRVLEDYMHGRLKEGALRTSITVDQTITEHLEQPEITSKTQLKDIFLIAASKEKASHDLYLSLAEIHPEGKVKELLKEMAVQDLDHKGRVEKLLAEIALPQTDGG